MERVKHLLAKFRDSQCTFLVKLESTGSAAEALEEEPAAALTEGQAEESLADKVVADSGGDWEIVTHLGEEVKS